MIIKLGSLALNILTNVAPYPLFFLLVEIVYFN